MDSLLNMTRPAAAFLQLVGGFFVVIAFLAALAAEFGFMLLCGIPGGTLLAWGGAAARRRLSAQADEK